MFPRNHDDKMIGVNSAWHSVFSHGFQAAYQRFIVSTTHARRILVDVGKSERWGNGNERDSNDAKA